MNRYAHEDENFVKAKRPTKRVSEKRVNDRRKYLARKQVQDYESRNERDVVYPEPEDDTYYRP